MFKIVTDPKTGKPRAETVSPAAAATYGNGDGVYLAKTEATPWKFGEERRRRNAMSGTPVWLTSAKRAVPPTKCDSSNRIKHSKDPPHTAPYVVNYQGASLWQPSERTEDTIPDCEQTTTHLRPSFGMHIHSRTCGLPAAAAPQVYRPPDV